MAANRKILIAMSMLLVAIFASVSVTFAWLSSGTNVSAMFTTIINAGKDSLFVMVDGKLEAERTDDFLGSNVKLTDLTYVESGGRWRLVNEDGSPADSKSYIVQEYTFYTNRSDKSVYFSYNSYVDAGKVYNSTVTGTVGARSFMLQDKAYWLKYGAADEKIAKFYGTTDADKTNDTGNKLVFGSDEAARTYYFNSSDGAYVTSAANAARIMFFTAPGADLFAEKAAAVWNPNDGAGYDLKSDGNYVYDQISSYYRNAVHNGTAQNDRNHASNTTDYTCIDEDIAVIPPTAWRTVAPGAHDYFRNTPYKCSMTIVMWVEGRDADCFNAIFNGMINAEMGYRLV